MRKGDLWLVEIPQFGGHEQEGLRPAIVIADTKTPVVIIIPCTSNIQALRFPFTFQVLPSKRNGLKSLTIALVFHLRAIDKRRLVRKIGTLEPASAHALNKMLKALLGF